MGVQITQGLPRINQLVNNSSTTQKVIYAYLDVDDDPEVALETKAKLESTQLGSICEHIKTVYKTHDR